MRLQQFFFDEAARTPESHAMPYLPSHHAESSGNMGLTGPAYHFLRRSVHRVVPGVEQPRADLSSNCHLQFNLYNTCRNRLSRLRKFTPQRTPSRKGSARDGLH